MIDEGYTKFRVDWRKTAAIDSPLLAELDLWRRRLYEAGLIGHDDRYDVGYGNLSVRDKNGFLISGTQTGHIENTDASHYARVTEVDIAANRVGCEGPVQASSESLTHAAIYAAAPAVSAVVHAHDDELWAVSLGVVPTTSEEVAYGTPDMAAEFARLLRDTSFPASGVAAMGGHQGGLLTIGRSIGEAASRMLGFAENGAPHCGT